MGTPYESIPPEREIAYLQNAAEAANQAAEPVVDELGKLAVVDATEATDLFAQEAAKIGTDADRFVQENDLSKQFSEAVEEARTDGVGDQAERYANFMADAYAAVDGDSRKALKYHHDFLFAHWHRSATGFNYRYRRTYAEQLPESDRSLLGA